MKILMNDVIPDDKSAEYYTTNQSQCIVYDNGAIRTIDLEGKESVLVPTTQEAENWDFVLMQMLVESVPESDKDRNISGKEINDPFCLLDIESYFASCDALPRQVVAHPSKTLDIPLCDIVYSEYCPAESAFILPPRQFLGVYSHSKSGTGVAVLNPHLVVRFDFE